jgi:hypothetical protein
MDNTHVSLKGVDFERPRARTQAELYAKSRSWEGEPVTASLIQPDEHRDGALMPGPIHTPTVLFMYAFKYRDALTGRWIKARYRAERHEIAARYREWSSSMASCFRQCARTRG